MRYRIASPLALAALVLAAATSSAAAIERFERTIRVERPGEVSVELDARAILHLGPAGEVALFGPDGARVAVARRVAAEDLVCRGARVAAIARRDGDFVIEIDVGEWAEPLGALRFELDEQTMAPGCRLEAGGEGGSWREIARETLFRLGEGTTLARTRLDFAPLRPTRLRLIWPAAAGYPAVRAVEACAAGETRTPPRAPVAHIEPAPALGATTRRLLEAPGGPAPLAALEVELAPSGPEVREYRIEFAAGGAWRGLTEGEWPAGSRKHRIDLGDSAVPSGRLRLELGGEERSIAAAEWLLVPQRLHFVAAAPGSYRLVYPAEGRGPISGEESAAEASTAALGPEASSAWRFPAPRPGAAAPDARFAARVAVEAPSGTAPGEPVALSLPSLVGEEPVDGAGSVRLLASGRQVPFRLEREAAPRTLPLAVPLAPGGIEAGESGYDLDLSSAGPGWNSVRLLLSAPPEETPFERTGRLVAAESRPGRLPVAVPFSWRCAARAGLPCVLRIDLPPTLRDGARLRFRDGDSAPLAGIGAELELARDRLVFQWPGDDVGVELAVNGEGIGVPQFDLSELDRVLAVAEPRPVTLGAPVEERPAAWSERHQQVLLVAALAMVSAVLLTLLARMLPRSSRRG